MKSIFSRLRTAREGKENHVEPGSEADSPQHKTRVASGGGGARSWQETFSKAQGRTVATEPSRNNALADLGNRESLAGVIQDDASGTHRMQVGDQLAPPPAALKTVAFTSNDQSEPLQLSSAQAERSQLRPQNGVPDSDTSTVQGKSRPRTMERARIIFRSKDRLRDQSGSIQPDLPPLSNPVESTLPGARSASTSKIAASSHLLNQKYGTTPRFPSRLSHQQALSPTSDAFSARSPTGSHSLASPCASPSVAPPDSPGPSLHNLPRPRPRSRLPTDPTSDAARRYCDVRQSWSEINQDELVMNLSTRERTRQEVLWEIVSSEDR